MIWIFSEDTWLKVLHVLQFACFEGFAHGRVSHLICPTSKSCKYEGNSQTLSVPPQRTVFSSAWKTLPSTPMNYVHI